MLYRTNIGGTPASNISAIMDEDGNASGSAGVTAAGQTLMDDAEGWIKDVEGMIQTAYGWTVDAGDDWRLQINENGQPGGWAAVVWGYEGNVDRMEIDLPDAGLLGKSIEWIFDRCNRT